MAMVLRIKKEYWTNLEDQPSKSNLIKIEKNLLLKIRTTNWDIVQENILMILNYTLLYLNFNNTCCKGYNKQVEKCIARLAIIY